MDPPKDSPPKGRLSAQGRAPTASISSSSLTSFEMPVSSSQADSDAGSLIEISSTESTPKGIFYFNVSKKNKFNLKKFIYFSAIVISDSDVSASSKTPKRVQANVNFSKSLSLHSFC